MLIRVAEMANIANPSQTGTWLYIVSLGTIWRNIYNVRSSNIETCLIGREIDQAFETLYNAGDKQHWTVEDDVINPFASSIICARDLVQAVWIFNLNTKHVLCHVPGWTFGGVVDYAFRHPFDIRHKDIYLLPRSEQSPHTLTTNVLDDAWTTHQCPIRRKVFTERILADFGFQWKHILCGGYNHLTFRRLATAIIKLVALDFHVVERAIPCKAGLGGDVAVCVHELPKWEPFSMSVVPTCGIPVVICRHVPAAIQLIFKYIQGNDETPNTYLILTVREVLLFQLRDRNGEPGVVKTASLFDGDDEGAPRREGARLLLQAITGPNIHVNSGGLGNHYLDRSLVEYLQSQPPFEQDISLHAMATSPLERRRLACSLCIGLKNYDAFESFQLYEGDQDAQRGTVVNQIWFDCFSGVAYNCGPPIAGKDHSTAYNTDEGHANDKRDENSNAGDDDTKHNGDKSKNDDHVNKYLRAANLQVYHGRLPDTSYKVKGDNNVIKVVYAKKGNIAKEACNAKRVDNADNSNVADNASGTVHGGDDEQTKIDHDMEELVKPGLSAICTKEWLKN